MPKRSRTQARPPRAPQSPQTTTPRQPRPAVSRLARGAPPRPPTLAERARQNWPYLLALLAAIIAIAVVAYLVLSAGSPATSGPTAGSTTTASAEEMVPPEGNTHIPAGQIPQYKSYPPASGPHYPSVASYGFFDREIPEGEWVHNLEHGGVVVLYKCEGGPTACPDLVNQLKDVYATFPAGKHGKVKMVIAPYTRMESPLTLLAWGWRERLDQFDKDRVLRFYKNHVDRGPEDVP